MKAERLNILIYGANVIFLLFALCVLLWLKQKFENDLETTVREIAALFPRNVIGDPDNQRVQFSQWEDRAQVVSRSQFIERVYLSKYVQDSGKLREFVLHPFDFSVDNGRKLPKEVMPDLRREELKDEEGAYGAIYYQLDVSPMQSVRIAVGTLAVLLTLALIVLTTRLWSQERALSKTTVELEEKSKQLVRLERLSLVGQLTANIFHDVRKPVLNIRHELEDLKETLGSFGGAAKGLAHIHDQVELFFSMLRDLNVERFVSARNEESEYVEVAKVVEQACRLVQYERGAVALNLQSEAGLPLVLAPPYRLVQVFSNLVLNAYQAMRGKGELHIRLKRSENMVSVEISDTGPGIPQMNVPHLFTPFFTTRQDEEGTGLGLYICRQIMDELGGEIRVRSNEGMGSTFIVLIPAAVAG